MNIYIQYISSDSIHNARLQTLILCILPSTLPRRPSGRTHFLKHVRSLNMHQSSFWSDPEMLDGENGHLARPEGKRRAREWTRAAGVVHGLADIDGSTVGKVCSFDLVNVHVADDGLVTVTGTQYKRTLARKLYQRWMHC